MACSGGGSARPSSRSRSCSRGTPPSGLFSSEVGQGSAPIAHAAGKTDEPVSDGVVALLEPFIDTIVHRDHD
ncbi:alanine:cation symporter family protein [Candidatus Palauibacter sp.]|uniref:alanine:cation symporter family protein n=1 Tax=Candidatus Palauibacter sp. TaxID=3101350 RepID=UPI003C6F42E1